MKRSFSFGVSGRAGIVVAGTAFIAATYGLVRLAYGLFLPDIQRDLGVGAATAGYISAGSSIIYCLAAAVGFVFARSAPRFLITCAAVAACGGVWGMSVAGNAILFGAGAVISSAAAGVASPALVSIVARNVRARDVDSAQSTVNAGTGPGLVAAGVLALVVLPDWRLGWMVVGVLTAGLAVAVWHADRPTSTLPQVARPSGVSKEWAIGHANCLVAAVFMGAGSSVVLTYGRSFLVTTGVGSEHDTMTAWIALGVGATAVILTARAVAALSPACGWMLSCALMTCAIVLLAFGPPRMVVALAGCVVFGWGFTASTSALISWTTAIAPDDAAAGTAMLFIALVFGQALGAGALGAVIAAAGYRAAFTVAAGLAAAAALTGALARSQRPSGVHR